MQKLPKYIRVNGSLYRYAESYQALNQTQYDLMDNFLRAIGTTWQVLNTQLQQERGGGVHFPMDRLMNLTSDEVVNAVNTLSQITNKALGFVHHIAPAFKQQTPAQPPPAVKSVSDWQIGGSFNIPKTKIKYNGRRYRLAADWGGAANVTQQQSTVGDEAKRLIFNVNKNQNLLVSNLMVTIAEAWHAIYKAATAAMPGGKVPEDSLAPMFAPALIPELNKLKTALDDAKGKLSAWKTKMPDVQKRVNQDTANKI